MKTRKYLGRYPKATQLLKERGLLLRGQYPTQRSVYLVTKEGVDIIYRFQRMDPSHLAKNSSLILEAAFEDVSRYEDIPGSIRYAEFLVEIWDGSKTRKRKPIERHFTTAYNPESKIMVYGASGWEEDSFSLSDKIDDILNIPKRYKDKMKTPTYKVKTLRLGVRLPR